MSIARRLNCLLGLVLLSLSACAPAARAAAPQAPAASAPLIARELKEPTDIAAAVREFYTKYEYKIPMRDGVHLHTVAYVPKGNGQTWPVLIQRTPYGVGPYGSDNYPREAGALRRLAPSTELLRQGYILVHQDVRGKMMSEGQFVDVRPVSPDMAAKARRDPKVIDETTDAYDTVDWLLTHVPSHNGRVGAWGISYPGFYAAQLGISGHPAVKAVSPQAPVTDWFVGDDFHHNGAFFLSDAFDFVADFGKPHPAPTAKHAWDFERSVPDIYEFFMNMGPLAGADERYMGGPRTFWRDVVAHGERDAYWKATDPRPFYKNVSPAVLTVGGWYDAEDLFGALETYRAFEKQSPGARNHLLMGPWTHGGWVRSDGDKLGDVSFAAKTSARYGADAAFRFFERHLKGATLPEVAEATVFETGTNQWREFGSWPPREAKKMSLAFDAEGRLRPVPAAAPGFDQYTSDPEHPVPYIGKATTQRGNEYMIADQRFAARRPDVLSYKTSVLAEEVAICGSIEANLWVSSTGTDSDFVVKLIDVHPDDSKEPDASGIAMAGYQELVRAEIMRAKFRQGLEQGKPLKAGEPTFLAFSLPAACHSFRAGHRIMVQVQSTWFPLADRNPHVFMDIYTAKREDFQTATQRVYRGGTMCSAIRFDVLRGSLP